MEPRSCLKRFPTSSGIRTRLPPPHAPDSLEEQRLTLSLSYELFLSSPHPLSDSLEEQRLTTETPDCL